VTFSFYQLIGYQDNTMKKQVYIAGPDVFSLDWPERAEYAQRACSDLGLVAKLPIPAQPLTGNGVTCQGSAAQAQQIFMSCVEAIKASDAVVANLMPFRGYEPDSGTVVECAIAYAMNKPVIGYASCETDSNDALGARRNPDGSYTCPEDGYLIEQFGLPFNLMVAGICTEFVIGNIDSALQKANDILNSSALHKVNDILNGMS
jgi:nucleoside 2-deoxyribosyltransferase